MSQPDLQKTLAECGVKDFHFEKAHSFHSNLEHFLAGEMDKTAQVDFVNTIKTSPEMSPWNDLTPEEAHEKATILKDQVISLKENGIDPHFSDIHGDVVTKIIIASMILSNKRATVQANLADEHKLLFEETKEIPEGVNANDYIIDKHGQETYDSFTAALKSAVNNAKAYWEEAEQILEEGIQERLENDSLRAEHVLDKHDTGSISALMFGSRHFKHCKNEGFDNSLGQDNSVWFDLHATTTSFQQAVYPEDRPDYIVNIETGIVYANTGLESHCGK